MLSPVWLFGGKAVRALVIGIAAALAYGAVSGAWFHFSDGTGSLLFITIKKLVPIDWLLIGSYMGMAIGFSHRGSDAADSPLVFTSGALAALLCTFVCHAMQYVWLSGHWELNGFIRYLAAYGDALQFGKSYAWIATLLASATGGAMAVFISSQQRADNIRAAVPGPFSETVRLLTHVARADGRVSEVDANIVSGFIRCEMLRTLSKPPSDMAKAVSLIIETEMDAIGRGMKLEDDLKSKEFAAVEQRERTWMLAVGMAQAGGQVSIQKGQLLTTMADRWSIPDERRKALIAEAMGELSRTLNLPSP